MGFPQVNGRNMENCKNCKHYCYLDKVTAFPGGTEIVYLEGFGCTKELSTDQKVSWRLDVDENTHHCDRFEQR